MSEVLRPAPETAVVTAGSQDAPIHYVARMPGGRIIVLTDTAAHIWQSVRDLEVVDEVVTDLAAAFDLPVDEVGPSVRTFLAELTDLGLLIAPSPES